MMDKMILIVFPVVSFLVGFILGRNMVCKWIADHIKAGRIKIEGDLNGQLFDEMK